jgi:hypothetical protein
LRVYSPIADYNEMIKLNPDLFGIAQRRDKLLRSSPVSL